MKKSFLKFHPLHQKITAFQKSPLYECKLQAKGEQNKLKKIGRNKLNHKDSNLPKINIARNKQNDAPQLHGSVSNANLHEAKNMSFIKLDRIYPEHKLNKMAHSQKLDKETIQQNRIKELALKKQFFIRDRKIIPQRNCVSAEIKKQNREHLPPSIKSIRQKIRRQQSRVTLQGQSLKKLQLSQQAKNIALQVRPFTSPNASKHPIRSPSLQDFLNNWIERH